VMKFNVTIHEKAKFHNKVLRKELIVIYYKNMLCIHRLSLTSTCMNILKEKEHIVVRN
jgi:hypothetical protein